MKIAIFTDTYLPTINGVSYAIESWKDELEKRGHEVTVVCPDADGAPSEATFKSIEIPFYEGYYAGFYPPTDHDFSDYDAVHVNSFFTVGYYGYRVAKKNNLKIISTVHTPIDEYLDYVTQLKPVQKLISRVYNRWEARLLKKADVRIALSEYMKNRIEEVTGEKDARRLTNGVNTNFFRPKDTTKFREKHGIEGKKIIGYAGRLSSEKRVQELIEFAEKFEGKVLIGGDGPYREKLESQVETDNVRFLGFIDREELPAFYSILDIMVFPSRVENDPLTVLEANACGTPVVGADAAGLKDSIEEGKNGYLFDPRNMEDLENSVEKSYSNLQDLNQSSIKKAEENSISNTVDKLLEFYSGD
ncbi:MAG: glycosyltransferase [Candidatus Nanosalina sp.]